MLLAARSLFLSFHSCGHLLTSGYVALSLGRAGRCRRLSFVTKRIVHMTSSLLCSMGSMVMSNYNQHVQTNGSSQPVRTGRPSSPVSAQRSAPPPAPSLNPSTITQQGSAEAGAPKSAGKEIARCVGWRVYELTAFGDQDQEAQGPTHLAFQLHLHPT